MYLVLHIYYVLLIMQRVSKMAKPSENIKSAIKKIKSAIT